MASQTPRAAGGLAAGVVVLRGAAEEMDRLFDELAEPPGGVGRGQIGGGSGGRLLQTLLQRPAAGSVGA